MERKLNILCVEDNHAQKKALEAVFRYIFEDRAIATILSDGHEALCYILENKKSLDLVITDYHLEGQDVCGADIARIAVEMGIRAVMNTACPGFFDVPPQVEVHEKMMVPELQRLIERVQMDKQKVFSSTTI